MWSPPDYSGRPFYKNPYFMGGSVTIAVGLFLNWWNMRPDESPVVPPVTTSTGTLDLFNADLTDAQAQTFKNSLPPLGQKYADMFLRAARTSGISPYVLAGIMAVETGFGAGCRDPLPRCRGVGGDDYGLMQINQRAHPAFFAKVVNGRPAYEDPWSSIEYGANLFATYKKYLAAKSNLTGIDLLRATASAYNAGPGNVLRAISKGRSPDSVTTGGAYGKKVMQQAAEILGKSAVA